MGSLRIMGGTGDTALQIEDEAAVSKATEIINEARKRGQLVTERDVDGKLIEMPVGKAVTMDTEAVIIPQMAGG